MPSIFLPTIKGVLYVKKKLITSYPRTSHVYQCHWLPTKEEAWLCSTYLKLFLGFSSVAPSCYGWFRLVPGLSVFTSDRFTKCFDLQTYYKRTSYQVLLQTRAKFIINWSNFDVSRNRATVIAKWASFFVLKSGTLGITKQGKYYKVGQFLFQSRAAITKRGNFYYKVGQILKVQQLLQSGAVNPLPYSTA